MVSSRPGTKFSIKNSSIVFRGVAQSGLDFRGSFLDINADRRSLPRRFDDERNGSDRALACADDFPIRRGTPCSSKFFLERILSKASSAFAHAFAGVGDAAFFQNPLRSGRLRRKCREWR